jgi:hypothetical protein
MALGAQRRTVTWIILRGSMLPVLWGALLGLALTFAVTPYLANVLYGVHAATLALCFWLSHFSSVWV